MRLVRITFRSCESRFDDRGPAYYHPAMNDHHGTDPRQRIEDARAEAAALLVQLPETERNEFGDLEERIAEISKLRG
ncbi:hypothetical protein BH20CHL6_BH20CHL6_08100 [soil metagenome]